MSLILQQSRQIVEAYQSNNEIRRRSRFIQRNREAGHVRLFNDYFSTSPVYPDQIFRRRFRMRKDLFCLIVNALQSHSSYFHQSDDAARRKGDHLDEYLRIGESIAIKCLFKFCDYMVELFGDRYLRRPNADDVQRLLQMHNERHDFPEMLGSLDCMHWEWKNYPVAWKGQFTRGHGSPTIVLEAIAS
ncbi:uncharacterized protein LOC121995109 [Zingiber officinale]|uniref:uncharacterized protein LOC121995109 n=1 Tax=Zingiber officinale TaxID=94328 RepID=UPI001C4D32BC|nr:uncharacterized protein LOC121995109 [Zingiber officinale]